ncbi:MAG TPA: AAA family ATPase [Ktedonobacterales bacterium]
MKRILVTGMSGTGKSAVIAELAARGYKSIDADCDDYSEWVTVSEDASPFGPLVDEGRDWRWREDRIRTLLATEDSDTLFVSGCAENMGQFPPQFDAVILLNAPAAVIVERLRTRIGNDYGKRPEEEARVLGLIASVESLLRRAASHEVDTSAPIADVVAAVLDTARPGM